MPLSGKLRAKKQRNAARRNYVRAKEELERARASLDAREAAYQEARQVSHEEWERREARRGRNAAILAQLRQRARARLMLVAAQFQTRERIMRRAHKRSIEWCFERLNEQAQEISRLEGPTKVREDGTREFKMTLWLPYFRKDGSVRNWTNTDYEASKRR